MTTPVKLDDEGRWWRFCGYEIDLRADPDPSQPRNLRVAVLAFRDREVADDEDVSALLLWLFEDHPATGGGCSACRTADHCPDQVAVHALADDWRFRQENLRLKKILSPEWRARLKALEVKNREHQP